MRFQEMDHLTLAGTVLGLVGGLLALIPNLERLLAFQPAWQEPMVLVLLAAGALSGVFMTTRDRPVAGGITTSVSGVVLAVLGPTGPGAIALVGGTLIFAATQEEGPARLQDDSPADSTP